MNPLQSFAKSGVRGWSFDKASLMGLPHVKQDTCVICGCSKNNDHHIVEKGMGGGSKVLHLHEFELLSPEFSVCGHGNTDRCHGDFHKHVYTVKWVSYDEVFTDLWWQGEILREGYKSNDPRFWDLGYYEIKRGNQVVKVIDHA